MHIFYPASSVVPEIVVDVGIVDDCLVDSAQSDGDMLGEELGGAVTFVLVLNGTLGAF